MNGTGRVHVYLGSATGLRPTPALSLTGPDGTDANYGWSVVGAGDVNGDGHADLAVAAPSAMTDVGRVHLYLGSATGLRPTPALSLTGPDRFSLRFGERMAGAGDLNGDGYADLAVGPVGFSVGDVHVYLGSARGLSPTPARTLARIEGIGNERSRTTVASVGDLNGDGYADLAIGAASAQRDAGRVYVYLGSATGPSPTPTQSLTGPDGAGGRFGASVTSSGDLNGDGYADLAVGAPGAMGGMGRVHAYPGRATGLIATPALSLTAPDDSGGLFGTPLARAGARRRVPRPAPPAGHRTRERALVCAAPPPV
jgi:hypothetical protein